ncbi:MAG: Energy-coupling factor transporter transmembrane protein CbiQ [Candidatus Accumulibacter adjunctus]|uniref:Energy-coupling factor transporter transmembrane protein CbiQ n=1 Tax=Candidatus Accumulibacter adjunctus TaxID=1454001 RepID=A0A011NX26_9PROT|nr:MAG: Energy-coupling factor transporter transmembrane protein CbiQ [Candidatus Accumulibacter adjunctus]
MLIEQAAYGNRWRRVSPAAKGSLALAGLLAAFVAATPATAACVALLLALTTVLGARVAAGVYLRVAAPAVGFLAIGSLSLLVAVGPDAAGQFTWGLAPDAARRVATLAGRSLASLAALLLLVLTTPLPDLIGLLRRLRVPEVLLDLMVLCYRMLFVLATAVRDTLTAQSARLGYASLRHGWRSLGLLLANLAVQIWQRAQALHVAAVARNGGGPLRFLSPGFANAGRDTLLAVVAGAALILFAVGLG